MVWISGGVYGLLVLATHYCGESIRAAWQDGMEGVVELPEWAEVLERNPRNRDIFLAQDPREFIATLEQWMLAYCPDPNQPVPGLSTADCAKVDVPTIVFRSGVSDPHHTRATSERLADVIPARGSSSHHGPTTSGSSAASRRRRVAACSNAGRCWRRSCSSSRLAAEGRPAAAVTRVAAGGIIERCARDCRRLR